MFLLTHSSPAQPIPFQTSPFDWKYRWNDWFLDEVQHSAEIGLKRLYMSRDGQLEAVAWRCCLE